MTFLGVVRGDTPRGFSNISVGPSESLSCGVKPRSAPTTRCTFDNLPEVRHVPHSIRTSSDSAGRPGHAARARGGCSGRHPVLSDRPVRPGRCSMGRGCRRRSALDVPLPDRTNLIVAARQAMFSPGQAGSPRSRRRTAFRPGTGDARRPPRQSSHRIRRRLSATLAFQLSVPLLATLEKLGRLDRLQGLRDLRPAAGVTAFLVTGGRRPARRVGIRIRLTALVSRPADRTSHARAPAAMLAGSPSRSGVNRPITAATP